MNATREQQWQRVLARADARAARLYRLYNDFRVKRESYTGRSDGFALYQRIHDQICSELSGVLTRASLRRTRLYEARAAERRGSSPKVAYRARRPVAFGLGSPAPRKSAEIVYQAQRAVRFEAWLTVHNAVQYADDDSDYQDYCDRWRSDQIGAF